MRVRFQNSEGLVFLPRVVPPVTIEAGTLAEDDRRSLEQLVKDATVFRPASHGPGPPGRAPAGVSHHDRGLRPAAFDQRQ